VIEDTRDKAEDALKHNHMERAKTLAMLDIADAIRELGEIVTGVCIAIENLREEPQ
jgi:hypothetical protein